jgi:catechol 2,3-dioxygenase-like lactoylglutathione lyase family enzyme
MSNTQVSSTSQTSTPEAVGLECVNPILRVGNLSASLDYYVRILGFKVDWQHPALIASVSRGRCHIFLCEGDQGNPGSWVWIGAGDVEPLFAEYTSKGAKIRHRPTNYEWAYEMQIEDLDGNVLRFGSDPKAGEPVGEWLDMHGDAWVKNPDGGYTRVARR